MTNIKGQKLISTHSPYIAGIAKLEELRHFSKKKDFTEIKQLDLSSLSSEEQRKINREVLNTRGEILFANGVILSEGDTEEQLIPVFAKKYFGRDIFEEGITVIGCNGNNYKGFLKLLKTFDINWFIFSDYDKPNIQKGVNNALSEIGLDPSIAYSNVILLGKGIEEYLLDEGYKEELKTALKNEVTVEKTNPKEIEATHNNIDRLSADEILGKLTQRGNKTKYAQYYARAIVNITDESRQIPQKILELLEGINAKLHPS